MEKSVETRRVSLCKDDEANIQQIDQESQKSFDASSDGVLTKSGSVNILMKTTCFLLICVLAVYSMYYMRDYIHAVLLWTELQPPYTVLLIFVCLYTLVSLPLVWGYIVVNLACGYLYGLAYGMTVTIITATLGVTIAHVLCKHVLASHIKSFLQQTEYIRSLHNVIAGQQAFKIVVLARLTPVPFGLQNAVFSVSSLSTHRYILASMLGLLPTQTLNVYMGSTLRSMEEVVTNSDNMLAGWVILIIQLIITFMVAMFIVKRARVELDKTIVQEQEPPVKEIVICP